MEPISKFSLSDLALLSWLIEVPERRFAIVNPLSGAISLWERIELGEDGLWSFDKVSSFRPTPEIHERFGGKMKFREYTLQKSGLIEMVRALAVDKSEKARFNDYVSDIRVPKRWNGDTVWGSGVLVLPTSAAPEWWESVGRPRYEKLIEKISEKKAVAAAKERVAVFGLRAKYSVDSYEGIHAAQAGFASMAAGIVSEIVPKWKGVRPAFSAVVVRETETRCYIRDAKRISNVHLNPQTTATVPVESWISKEYLLLDNATEVDIAKLKTFDEGVCTDYVEMRDRTIDAMVPALVEALRRGDQKSAEIDGTFADMLADIRSKK